MRNLIPSLDQAARNLIASWIYKILAAASAFLLTGWATRVFGLDAMGIVILANGVVAYLMLLDFGASSALPRMLPQFLASKDQARADQLLSTATIFLVPLAAVVVLLSPLMAQLVVRFAMIPSTLHEAAFWVMCVNVAAAGIAVPFRLGFGMLGCISRFDLFFLYELGGIALKLALAGTMLAAGFSLPWYAAAVAIPPVFIALAQFAAGLRSMRPSRIRVSLFRSWALAALLSMCGASLVMSFASVMTTQGGTILIGALGASSDVALFGFPLILVATAMSLAGPFGAFLSPIVNALHGTQETQRMRSIVVVAVRLATALAGLIAAGLVVMGPAVLPVWLGHEAVSGNRLEAMTALLWIFALGFAAFVPGSALKGLLMSAGSPWPLAVVEVAAAAAALLLAAVLYAGGGFGLNAIALAVSAGLIVRGLVLFPWLAARAFGEKLLPFLRTLYGRPLAVTSSAALLAAVAHASLSPASPLVPLAVLAVFALAWSIGCYWFVFPPQVTERIARAWRFRIP